MRSQTAANWRAAAQATVDFPVPGNPLSEISMANGSSRTKCLRRTMMRND
jgi:hypothetical protein